VCRGNKPRLGGVWVVSLEYQFLMAYQLKGGNDAGMRDDTRQLGSSDGVVGRNSIERSLDVEYRTFARYAVLYRLFRKTQIALGTFIPDHDHGSPYHGRSREMM
jgi:hypothetical protein